MPDMIPVSSSNIASVGYDEERQELYVQFHTGTRYVYSGVPAHIYEAFFEEASPGRHFIYNVRGIYPARKV
jgi:hypothetical protein